MGHSEVGLPGLWPFALASLAVWRVTHLLQAEDGPWALAARWRAWLGVGLWGQMFACFYCLSVWVAAVAVPWLTPDGMATGLVVWAALSGAAILIERVHARLDGDTPPPPPANAPSANWFEDPMP